MNDDAEGVELSNATKVALASVFILLVIGAGSLWLIFGQSVENQLMPLLPTPTPPISVPQQEPETVTFTELNENPLAYLNNAILVTGEYLPVDQAECLDVVGPNIRWSLAADSLQLDVVGFERIVRLLPAGTTMTVQGIWQLYQGPLGCGKGPPHGSLWYLDAKKIVQPNPLVSEGGQAISVEIRHSTLAFPQILSTESAIENIPTATPMTVTATAEGTILPLPTDPSQLIPTQTPVVPGEITPSPTASLSPTGGVPTNTPDPNATLPAATDSATAVPTNNPGSGTPTLTPETPPLPATATKTNGGGYPGPEETFTPTPTATPNPYP